VALRFDETLALREQRRERYGGWSVWHFFSHYKADGGKRKGQHRKKRDRKPLPGMMMHQDGSRHEWLAGQWRDPVVTVDDATRGVYSMFLVEEEGTASSFAGMREAIDSHGLPGGFHGDRHDWHTPEAGGKADKSNPTRFGRAMRQLNIRMIAACIHPRPPQTRGRSERRFKMLQDRLPKELALLRITNLEAANRFIQEEFLKRCNEEFRVAAREEGSAFVAWIGGDLADILRERHARTAGSDNCVKFEKRTPRLPMDKRRCHYVKARVEVHRYPDGRMAVFHGQRRLADYTVEGKEVKTAEETAAHRVA
jgi:hypothetical protein